MQKDRRIFNEKTVRVTFRVPISKKPMFQKDVNALLDKYDVRIPSFAEFLVNSNEKTPKIVFGNQEKKYFEKIPVIKDGDLVSVLIEGAGEIIKPFKGTQTEPKKIDPADDVIVPALESELRKQKWNDSQFKFEKVDSLPIGSKMVVYNGKPISEVRDVSGKFYTKRVDEKKQIEVLRHDNLDSAIKYYTEIIKK